MRIGPLIFISSFLFGSLQSCGQKNTPPAPAALIKGADISWITEMESSGKKFYSTNGVEKDPFLLMKELGAKIISETVKE